MPPSGEEHPGGRLLGIFVFLFINRIAGPPAGVYASGFVVMLMPIQYRLLAAWAGLGVVFPVFAWW
jgi:hypothetical protein